MLSFCALNPTIHRNFHIYWYQRLGCWVRDKYHFISLLSRIAAFNFDCTIGFHSENFGYSVNNLKTEGDKKGDKGEVYD